MSELQKPHKTFSNPISWWILNILTTCFIATAIAAFAVRSTTTRTSSGVRVLRLGHGLSADHPVHQAMLQMSERLRELSAGTMVLQIYPGGMIGSEDECFKQAQNAQIEFAKCSAAVLDGSVPEFQVVGAPFLFRDSDHFWAVMNGEIGKSLLKKIDGLMGIRASFPYDIQGCREDFVFCDAYRSCHNDCSVMSSAKVEKTVVMSKRFRA